MRIKRVDAPTVSEALRLLRQELGDNALILHTKTITGTGVTGLFRRPRVEIIGAVDEPGIPVSLSSAAALETLAEEPLAAVSVAAEPSSTDKRRDAIAQRLAKFRAAVPMIPIQQPPPPSRPDPTDAPASDLGLRFAPSDWDPVGHRPRRIAFVGPTGAGKTTTLAKVAARAQLQHQRRVSLITIDTYRIGAVPQLASYASILGVPIAVARTPEDLVREIDQAKKADLIFIDTIGRSPLGNAVDGLKPFMQAAAADVVHLVVSATTRTTDSLRAASSFASLGPNRLCMTKLDETEDHETLSAVGQAVSLPLTWLGVGQDVPDDLEEADAVRVAELLRRGCAA